MKSNSSEVVSPKDYIGDKKFSRGKKEDRRVISFEEYQNFYEYLSNDFKLEGYEQKYASHHDFIGFLGSSWELSKRKYLIIPSSNPRKPTYEMMLFENKDRTQQITVEVCFNNKYIGKSVHLETFVNSDLKNINIVLNSMADSAIVSYRNVLFHVQVRYGKKYETGFMVKVLEKLADEVDNYFKKTHIKFEEPEKVSITVSKKKPNLKSKGKNEDKSIVSYKKYEKFCEYLFKKFNLHNYDKKYATKHDFVIYVGPVWPFGGRECLTLSGENVTANPISEYMILENKEGTCQIIVSANYNDNYVGNELHSLSYENSILDAHVNPYRYNKKLRFSAMGAVSSYKNIIFHVQVVRTKEDGYIIGDTLREINYHINSYFKL